MNYHLNPKEEEVMQILWHREQAFVKEIIADFSDSKVPYNTISSIVRKLEKDGLVGHEAFGNTHRYFPVLKKEDYRKRTFKQFFQQYFENSTEKLLTHFVKEEKVDIKKLEQMIRKMKK